MTCIPLEGGLTFDYALIWRTGNVAPLVKAFLAHAGTSPPAT